MLTPLQKKKQTHLFRLIDVDNNQFMEKDDWTTIAQRLATARGIKEGSKEYKEIVATAEGLWDGLSGFISSAHPDKATLDEWMTFVDEKIIHADTPFYESSVNAVVKGIFALMDDNGNGVIDAWEYLQFLGCFGVTDGAAHAAFTDLDLNGDGTLDESELIKSVKQFFKSDDSASHGNSLFGPLNWFK